MIWVWVLIGIAVVGLGVVIAYGVWLWHKATDVMAEVSVLFDRLDQLGALAAQITVPASLGGVDPFVEVHDEEDDELLDEAAEHDGDTGEDADETVLTGAARPRRARPTP